MPLPRGVRNRSPFNLRYNAGVAKYVGCTGKDEGGYAIFDTPQHGIRAAMLNLQSYAGKGIDTIRGIVTHWAPAADGNNVAAYVKDVTGRTTWNADEHLDLGDRGVLLILGRAMIWHENGSQPYTEVVLLEGIDAALKGEQ